MNIYEKFTRKRNDDLDIIRRYIAAFFVPDNNSNNTNMAYSVLITLHLFIITYMTSRSRDYFCGEP
jgi:hypothetical protein